MTENQKLTLAFRVLEGIRNEGNLIVIKLMPKKHGFIIEGSRSEYDAPCEGRTTMRGKVLVERHNLKLQNPMDWRTLETFGDTVPEAIFAFVENYEQHKKELKRPKRQ